MKFCIVIEEILRREVVAEGSSLEDALLKVKNAYDNLEIVLDYNDIVPNASDGKPANFYQSDRHDYSEVQQMEVDNI